MNNGWRGFTVAADSPRIRFAVALIAAASVWVVFLAHFVRLYVQGGQAAPAPQTIEMRLVDFAPAEPLPPRQAQSQAPAHAASVKTEPHRYAPRPARTTAAPTLRRELSEAIKVASALRTNAPQPSRAEMATTSARPQAAVSVPALGSVASRDANETSLSGSTQAHLLSQPLPVLPDDLREDAYRAQAVARFHVHADGSIDVELVKPTPNPRLNQILLETLHRWRFFPALENGHPVESRQDVRVHFNVS